jgi:hypothetical protein
MNWPTNESGSCSEQFGYMPLRRGLRLRGERSWVVPGVRRGMVTTFPIPGAVDALAVPFATLRAAFWPPNNVTNHSKLPSQR